MDLEHHTRSHTLTHSLTHSLSLIVNNFRGNIGIQIESVLHFKKYLFTLLLNISSLEEDNWFDYLKQAQLIALYLLASISLAMVVGMIALLAYVYLSFASRTFAAGVLPLRILRYLVSVLSGILYIPLLHVFLICTRSRDVALVCMGAIGVIMAVPFCLFMSFSYFQPNPSSRSIMARVDASLELLDLIARTTIVFLDAFGAGASTLCGVILFTSLFFAVYVAVRLPYYDKRINGLRFVLFMNVAMVALLGLIALVTHGPLDVEHAKGDAFSIAFLAMVPIISVLSALTFRWSYRRSTQTIYLAALASMDENKNFEIKHNFASPFAVELAARFLRDTAVRKKIKKRGKEETITLEYNSLALRVASQLYEQGLRQFPDSAKMLVLFGLFSGIYHEDLIRWRMFIQKAQSCRQSFLTGLMIAQVQTECEQAERRKKSGADLDTVDVIEIQVGFF